MKGLIVINAYSENGDYLYQAHRLLEEFSFRGVCVELYKNRCGMGSILPNGEIELATDADFAVFLDKDKYVMRLLEQKGVRLFNSASAIELCDDKMLTHLHLAQKGIPMPKIIPAPFCYTPQADIPETYTKTLISSLGLPVVVKHSYGSLGREVFLAKTEDELFTLAQNLRLTPHFYQQYVAESHGKDLRVIAVGKRPIAAMLRTSNEDFRSNIALGGRGEPFALTQEIITLTQKITSALSLDYCGIDFLFGKEGLILCEVNSNAFFKGMEKATGINIAAAYTEYILQTLKEKV